LFLNLVKAQGLSQEPLFDQQILLQHIQNLLTAVLMDFKDSKGLKP